MPTGRGAWTTKGMPANGTGFYRLLDPVRVGSEPTKSYDHLAVNYGVKVIQMRLNGLGWQPRLVVDGVFGESTDIAVRFTQGMLGLWADGRVGPKTMTILMWGPIQVDATDLSKTIGGIVAAESGFDPGAVSSVYTDYNGPDRGLVQINVRANPDIKDPAAFHHRFAFQYANQRIRAALNTYKSSVNVSPLDLAIASYNSPGWAQEWFRTGQAPNAHIAAYVERIKSWQPPTA